jgi:hypothetical protein
MAYLMLYGNGWTQRWRIEDGKERQVQDDITRLGRSGTIQLPVLDPGTNSATTLVVSCALVAAAIVLDSESRDPAETATGQYA